MCLLQSLGVPESLLQKVEAVSELQVPLVSSALALVSTRIFSQQLLLFWYFLCYLDPLSSHTLLRKKIRLKPTQLQRLNMSCSMQVAVVFGVLAALLAFRYWWYRRNAVYLLDLACFKPPDRLKVSVERFLTGSRASGVRHPSKARVV